MTVRSFQAKIVCATPEQRNTLELTHQLFNEHLPGVMQRLYGARHGRFGPEYEAILQSVKNAQSSSAQVEAISSLDAAPGKTADAPWKQIARDLLKQKKILFDRKVELPGFSKEFRRKIFETAFAIILSHEAKMQAWHAEHQTWLGNKAEWEHEHPEYLAAYPILQQFAAAEGKVSKRRGRWRRWLDFLVAHPQLAAWRGGPAHVVALTADELGTAMARRHKPVQAAFELFWNKNPELKELDRLHGEYDRKFVRSWVRRCNNDRFRHPPTLTLPSADKHPAWYSFKRDASYQRLNIQRGTIELKVIQSADPQQRLPRGYVNFQFRADARLQRFFPAAKEIKIGRVKCDLLYHMKDGTARPAAIQGVKLVFRGGQPYLYFSAFIEDAPSRLAVQQRSLDKYSPDWCIKKIKETPLDPPLRTMAIDLGIRHIAAATILYGDTLVATRFVHNRPVSPLDGRTITGIPTIGQIKNMKWQLRRCLRRRGKPVHGQEACIRLQAHVRAMAKDRFRKCANAIVDLARAHQVDLILMENLKDLVPDAERERGINRALINWNRGNLALWLKMIAEVHGIRVLELPPYWTSQVCHKCNQIGQRYSMIERTMTPQTVGKLFGCPSCGYSANADFNASINLHRILHGTFPKVRSLKNGRVSINGTEVGLSEVRSAWEQHWAQLELLKDSPF